MLKISKIDDPIQRSVSQHCKFCLANESMLDPHAKKKLISSVGHFQRFASKVVFEPIITEHYADPHRPRAICLNEHDSIIAAMRSERRMFLNEATIESIPTLQFIRELEKISSEIIPRDVLNLQYDGNAFPDFAGVRIFDNYEAFGFERLSEEDVAPIVIVDIPCIAKDANAAYAHIAKEVRKLGYEAQKPRLVKISDTAKSSGEDLALLEFQFESRLSTFKFVMRDKLHHVTSAVNFESIKKNGLVPKSDSREFSYSERVYLFNSAADIDKLNYGSYACSKKATGSDLDNLFCIFTIDAKRFQHDRPEVRFSVDGTFSSYSSDEELDIIDDSALFTESPIPLKYIEDDMFVFKHDAIEKLRAIPDGKKMSMRHTTQADLEMLAKTCQ